MQRLEALGVPIDIQWRIYALHESLSRKAWPHNGLLEFVASTIRVKQECPLSSTLFGLYRDEISHNIERFGGLGAFLEGIAIQMLLYDDIVLISDSLVGLQRHLNTLKQYLIWSKVCRQIWLKRSDGVGRGKGGIHTLLHIPRCNIYKAPYGKLLGAWPSHRYAALSALERQSARLQFQEPWTKLWLFDTLVTPTLLYGVETWGLSLNKAFIVGILKCNNGSFHMV